MIRIMRQKTYLRNLKYQFEVGKYEGMQNLISMIKAFAKEGGGQYFFAPVRTEHLEVQGNAFFIEVTCGGALITGNVTTDSITMETSSSEECKKALEAAKKLAAENGGIVEEIDKKQINIHDNVFGDVKTVSGNVHPSEFILDDSQAVTATTLGDVEQSKPKITAGEFEAGYIERSHLSQEEYDKNFVTLPCDCEEDDCQGWAAIHASGENIRDHMRIHGPQNFCPTCGEAMLVQPIKEQRYFAMFQECSKGHKWAMAFDTPGKPKYMSIMD